jgi:chemotaxis protein CheX
MSVQETIVDFIGQTSAHVFSTMLGVELRQGRVSIESKTPEANDGIVSFIGLAGAWAGTGSLSCSPALACRICSQMLMTESTSVDEEVLDTVAELTNMIIGGVKTELERVVGPLGLSIPTVVYGRNFKAKTAGGTEWIVVEFHWEEEPLTVRLCLAPTERSGHVASHPMSQACGLDV